MLVIPILISMLIPACFLFAKKSCLYIVLEENGEIFNQ